MKGEAAAIGHETLRVRAKADIDRAARDGRFPSDHYPVTAVLKLK